MVTFEKISNNRKRCEKFSNISFTKSNGSEVKVPYLQQGETYIFHRANQPDKWLGGFCINTESNWRYFGGLSPKEIVDMLAKHGINQKDLLEVGCLWLNSQSISKTERYFFYLLLIFKVLASGKKIIMGGSFIPKVAELHMKILPNLLHEGLVTVAGKTKVAKFYFGYKSVIPFYFFRGFFFDLAKTFKKKWRMIKPFKAARPYHKNRTRTEVYS
jgi:hypothetical protein